MASDRVEAEELLRTLFVDPHASLVRAKIMLAGSDDPAVASIAHQVIGIVLRDRGDTDEALAELRSALHQARRSADGDRVADVRATLGATLAYAGRVRVGLAQLDRAARALQGVSLGRVLVRRAGVLSFLLARFEDSAADLRRASDAFSEAGDITWEARALNFMGVAQAGLGDLDGATASFRASGELSARAGNALDVALTVQNAGWVAVLAGDLPTAFAQYSDAAARLEPLGGPSAELVVDRCHAYLAAGLAQDALEIVEAGLSAGPLQPRQRADLLVAVAQAALAAGDLRRATAAADDASRLLRTQGRGVHRLRAELIAISARTEAGLPAGPLLRRAERLISSAREEKAPDLAQSLLLGARLACQVRSARAAGLADAWLEECTFFRRSSLGTTRALGWLALARRNDLAGDARGALRACDRGLRALDDHRAMLGSQELRALASRHGSQLAALGTRTALGSGDARRLLRWSERWRAIALSVPPATEDHDPATATDLAALRAVRRQVSAALADGEPADRLEARAARLEQSVRQRLLHARGTGGPAASFDVGELLAALVSDDTVLVELAEVDGFLHALVAHQGRVRRFSVGPAADAETAVTFALFALRQAARGGRSRLDVAGARLQRALLGPAAGALGDRRIVVSPTSNLQGVPWGLIPALAGLPVTTTPSALMWIRSREARPAPAAGSVFLVGPGLGSGGAEVPAVTAHDPGAVVLAGEQVTVEAALRALDGARLAHVAAHGQFRDDSPLFSSLTLADGPLLVHDLQRLRRAPHRVVLSACESGVMKPVGAQELLGLSAALLSMGTAGIVSSLAEVDDHATVEVMVALHGSLREGNGLGEAMLAARTAAAGDPVVAATAAAFTVLGT